MLKKYYITYEVYDDCRLLYKRWVIGNYKNLDISYNLINLIEELKEDKEHALITFWKELKK